MMTLHLNSYHPDMISSVDKAWTDDWLRRTPLGRMGTTDEVGRAVVALASNQFTFMTGGSHSSSLSM